MKVAINIPIIPGGRAGGVEQFLIGLVSGLRTVDEHEYVLVTHPRAPDWIKEYAGGDMEVVPRPWNGITERGKAFLGPLTSYISPFVRPFFNALSDGNPSVPDANGFFENLGVDVVHFPNQIYQRTEVPSIFNPHDLQHEHYPEYFSETELRQRRLLYRTACEESVAVEVPSQFVREDLIDCYDINPEKIHVVERGPPVELYDNPDEGQMKQVQNKFGLPKRFALYPARTWPHKNHGRLVEAIARLRDDRGEAVTLVCTGGKTDHWGSVSTQIDKLNLNDQIRYLGFVEPTELRALYDLAEFIIFPSLFEGGGFPLLEAWAEDTPIACSNVTSLSEKAGNAAELFDPTNVENIGDAIHTLHIDQSLREQLTTRGAERIEEYSWEQTAKSYNIIYEHVDERQ